MNTRKRKNREKSFEKLLVRNMIAVFFVLLICSFQSCKQEDDQPNVESCSMSDEFYIIINEDKYAISQDEEGLIFGCMFDSTFNGYIIAIDEFRHTIGGVIVNDVIGVLIKSNKLEEGVFPLKRNEDFYCQNNDFNLMDNEAISSIQVNNCCEFFNEDAELEIVDCDGTFVIIGESINYSEYVCESEQGGSFTASFRLPCY